MKNITSGEYGIYADIKVNGVWENRKIDRIEMQKGFPSKMVPELKDNEILIETITGTEIVSK